MKEIIISIVSMQIGAFIGIATMCFFQINKSNGIVLALSTLLVVCNALPMNNHVENKKEEVISQKEASKKKSKKKDVSKDENNEGDKTVNDTSRQTAEENTIQEDQESVKSDVHTQEKTSNQNTNENKTQKKVETKQTPVQPVESNQPSSVTPSQPASSGNTTNAQQPQKEEQTKILRVTYWVKCDCGKELTHSIDYKDYESYYNSNDYSVKILINQLLDEGHCAGNEEVCGASHYRYGTNENWIYK